LNALLVKPYRSWSNRARDHVNDRWRHPLEDLDSRAFGFRQVATRFDRPRRSGKENPINVGLSDKSGHQDQQDTEH
jgi:hypothetical protein